MRYPDDPRNPFTHPQCAAVDNRQLVDDVEVKNYYALATHFLDNYNVFVIFFDRKSAVFDMSKLFTDAWNLRHVFEPLADRILCSRVHPIDTGHTIAWTDDIDLPASAFYYDCDNLWPDLELKEYNLWV